MEDPYPSKPLAQQIDYGRPATLVAARKPSQAGAPTGPWPEGGEEDSSQSDESSEEEDTDDEGFEGGDEVGQVEGYVLNQAELPKSLQRSGLVAADMGSDSTTEAATSNGTETSRSQVKPTGQGQNTIDSGAKDASEEDQEHGNDEEDTEKGEDEEDAEDDEDDEEEEEDEPALKYQRLGPGSTEILVKDTASVLTSSSRFIVSVSNAKPSLKIVSTAKQSVNGKSIGYGNA